MDALHKTQNKSTLTYTPPFSITSKTIHLIADISAQTERYAIRMQQEDSLLLRKINRIKTIRGSLAIEGNTLSESMITDIIEGKNVIAPIREIQEVKNAIDTYNVFSSLNPYKVEDILHAHRLMMKALIDDAGKFRNTAVGVFGGKQLVHMAPPADRVSFLIKDLFEWLQKSDEHLLIKSAVFHYEFEFIHPFSDGNGRMGRLWQSLILTQLHPIFEHLPVENIVFQKQQEYYQAINQSTSAADCGIFVEFMLTEILATLKKRQGEALDVGANTIDEYILLLVQQEPGIKATEIASLIPYKTKRTIERQISKLKTAGLIEFRGATKTGGYYLKGQ